MVNIFELITLSFENVKIFGIPVVHLFLEIFLVALIFLIWRSRRIYPNECRLRLSAEEEEELIRKWEPKPLVSDSSDSESQTFKINSKITKYINIDGVTCLNMATTNFLDFVGDENVEQSAIKCISEYAVGTCGPRGFYGTTDVHLELEKKLAEFCGTEHAIAYSYGFSTFSSAISSYCKKQDIIFADEGISYPTQMGILSSRSKVYWFKHNDLEDLKIHLEKVQQQEYDDPKKFRNIRKYMIVEGLYENYGDIPNLKTLVEFKYKYKTRIMIEESFSIGVLGANGKGILEHFNVDVNDIDLRSFSFENTFASCGGACVGTTYVIEHQRLSGVGYCFSASSPTYLCQAVIDEIDILTQSSEKIQKLHQVTKKFFNELKGRLNSKMEISGHKCSPLLHLRFKNSVSMDMDSKAQQSLLMKIYKNCLKNKLVVLVPNYLYEKEYFCPKPSIRLTLNCSFTDDEIHLAVETLNHSINNIIEE